MKGSACEVGCVPHFIKAHEIVAIGCVMLDHLATTTGWSRANAGRALTAARKPKGAVKAVKRVHRKSRHSFSAHGFQPVNFLHAALTRRCARRRKRRCVRQVPSPPWRLPSHRRPDESHQ